MKQIQWFFMLFVIITGIISCSEDTNIFTVGSDFLESNTNIIMVDTFSVNLSTVIIDSLPTSSVDTLLIGNYIDEIFGKISCNSFFEFGLPASTNIQDNDIYDSITLSMEYTGYSYGDTLQSILFSIHLLSERINLNETNYLYNTSNFAFQETPLASCSLTPHPISNDSTVEFKLNDIFGQELFDLMQDDADLMASQSAFIAHYKGLAIISDTVTSSSIVGFISSDEDINIKLYTHRSEEVLKDIIYEFPLVNSEKQFNAIKHNYANTPLENITSQREDIPSHKMENKAYMQSGVGLMTKIQFPSMQEFLLYENSFILRAELYIRPAAGSYNTNTLTNNVYLYNTDKTNALGNILYNSDGSVLTSIFSFDEFYHDQTYYLFDITNFLKAELSDFHFDYEHALLVSTSDADYLCSFDRIIFDDNSNKPQLKIYYMNY